MHNAGEPYSRLQRQMSWPDTGAPLRSLPYRLRGTARPISYRAQPSSEGGRGLFGREHTNHDIRTVCALLQRRGAGEVYEPPQVD